MGRPERKRSFGRRVGVREDNIKMDFQEVGWEGMDYTVLTEDWDRWQALVNAVTRLRVLYNVWTIWLRTC